MKVYRKPPVRAKSVFFRNQSNWGPGKRDLNFQKNKTPLSVGLRLYRNIFSFLSQVCLLLLKSRFEIDGEFSSKIFKPTGNKYELITLISIFIFVTIGEFFLENYTFSIYSALDGKGQNNINQKKIKRKNYNTIILELPGYLATIKNTKKPITRLAST